MEVLHQVLRKYFLIFYFVCNRRPLFVDWNYSCNYLCSTQKVRVADNGKQRKRKNLIWQRSSFAFIHGIRLLDKKIPFCCCHCHLFGNHKILPYRQLQRDLCCFGAKNKPKTGKHSSNDYRAKQFDGRHCKIEVSFGCRHYNPRGI